MGGKIITPLNLYLNGYVITRSICVGKVGFIEFLWWFHRWKMVDLSVLKKSRLLHLCFAITFFSTGLIVNLIQCFFYVFLRPFNKHLYRKINWYLCFTLYSGKLITNFVPVRRLFYLFCQWSNRSLCFASSTVTSIRYTFHSEIIILLNFVLKSVIIIEVIVFNKSLMVFVKT